MPITFAEAQNAEKIVLITDKEWYYPGESLWFTLNIFDACGDTLSNFSKIAYVELIGSDNKPVHQMKVAVNDAHGAGSFTIGENIITGNYSVIAYTNWMKNFGVGSYSRHSVQVVNPLKMALLNVGQKEDVSGPLNAAGIKVDPSKKRYTKRERVSVSISGIPSSLLSVSVFRMDALQKGAADIIDKAPANPCKVDPNEALPFIMEDHGHIISGRVIDKRSLLPAAGIRGYLSVINSPNDLYVATSDSSGTIRFDVGDLPGKKELVLQTNRNIDSNYSIELVNPYAEQALPLDGSQKQNVFESMPGVVNDAMVSAQVQRVFYTADAHMEDTIGEQDAAFYGKPDAFYLMADYVHFTTVEEIFREYVTFVGVQKRNGQAFPIVYDMLSDREDRKPFPGPPLVLINGVPLFDPDRFMDMNTDEFYSISVVGKKYFMGYQTFYGIIDVRLNTSLKNFGRDAIVTDYDGADEARQFSSPTYRNEEERNGRKPDFRNVLYWNPALHKDKNGNCAFDFYSSDLEGEYAIVVRAVSEKGKVETSETFIQVK
jgi:hypothetical protein